MNCPATTFQRFDNQLLTQNLSVLCFRNSCKYNNVHRAMHSFSMDKTCLLSKFLFSLAALINNSVIF